MADLPPGIDATVVDYGIPAGVLRYYPNFFSAELADFFLETFALFPFAQGEVRAGMERRLSVFFSTIEDADGGLREYKYAGKVNIPLRYTDELLEMQDTIRRVLGVELNSCLANLYRTGRDVIGWHSDSEQSLVMDSAIASVSLGAPRWFEVAAKNSAPDPDLNVRIQLGHGSLLVMGGTMQKYYKHRIRPEAAVQSPRINLTFRLSR